MGLNTTAATWVTGTVVTAAQLNLEVRDAVNGIQAAWTAYTPTWTGATTSPTNYTGDGYYMRVGKTITFYARVLANPASFTVGSGQYSVSLPVAAATITGTQASQLVSAECFDASAVSVWESRARIASGATSALIYCPPGVIATADRAVSSTVPFTFTNSDAITVMGTYQAA